MYCAVANSTRAVTRFYKLTRDHHRSILDSFKLGQKPRLPSPETDLPCLADESYATKTMAAPLLCLLWQHRPNLVSQFVYQHPISSLPGLTARDHSAYGPLLGPVLMRGVLWGFLHHEEGLAFTKQLSQLVSWFLGNCNWLLDQYSTGDGAFMAEVLEEALVRPAIPLTMNDEFSLQCLTDGRCSLATSIVLNCVHMYRQHIFSQVVIVV